MSSHGATLWFIDVPSPMSWLAAAGRIGLSTQKLGSVLPHAGFGSKARLAFDQFPYIIAKSPIQDERSSSVDDYWIACYCCKSFQTRNASVTPHAWASQPR